MDTLCSVSLSTRRKSIIAAQFILMPTTATPRPLRLPAENEVHVWTMLVSEYSNSLSDLQCLLSAEESRAAARFVHAADRVRYIVSHGLLRRLLGGYLSLSPAGLRFVAGEFGKPALVLQNGQPPLCFNMAHSGEVIVYGVTLGRQVGVDVEVIRSSFDVMDLARGQFSQFEIEALEAASAPERVEAFFRCWARKEAYLKARGVGLGYPLNHFAVSIGLADPPVLRWVKDQPDAGKEWSMFHLHPPIGYAGAAVVEGRPINLLYFGPGRSETFGR